ILNNFTNEQIFKFSEYNQSSRGESNLSQNKNNKNTKKPQPKNTKKTTKPLKDKYLDDDEDYEY
ncbi:MAG: hypothetical protein OEY49_16060, partial [Candidatus Heimdallarchaeota archaeon]|nr:hypothetical protein [Candidatus Heimdallarchaeota archaeon]